MTGKKDFTKKLEKVKRPNNPALNFITEDEDGNPINANTADTVNAVNTSYFGREVKYTKSGDEVKSAAVNMRLRPTIYDRLKMIAWTRQASANDIINELIENYVGSHEEEEREYIRFHEKKN